MAKAKSSQKLKPILPSLREKKRYIRFKILSSEPVNPKDVFTSIWERALSLLGELGVAKAGIWVLEDKYDSKKQEGVLKVSHTGVDDIKASLALVTHIKTTPVIIQTTNVSGMIKKV